MVLRVLIIVVIVVALWLVSTYNRLVRNRNMVKEAWSGIDVQLKRRTNLIPNLVEAVKGYMGHERGRAGKGDGSPVPTAWGRSPWRPEARRKRPVRSLANLFAVAEKLPGPQGQPEFLDLQKQLSDLEDRFRCAGATTTARPGFQHHEIESFPSNLGGRRLPLQAGGILRAVKTRRTGPSPRSPSDPPLQWLMRPPAGRAFRVSMIRRMLRRLFFMALLLGPALVGAASVSAAQPERILAYASDIAIHEDAAVTVTETIRVAATGDRIKRGIYRDFPTRYQDRYGNRVRVDFQLLSVKRDGKAEPFHTEDQSNGVRVYAGSANVFLPPGIYTYEISYRTSRQIGFFRDFDELYWNVTGNGWEFSIEKVKATVHLPGGTAPLQTTAYTGISETRAGISAWKPGRRRGGLFRHPHPGRWRGTDHCRGLAQGLVAEPGAAQKAGYFLSDNRASLTALIGLIVLFVYYLIAWARVGRDPKKGPSSLCSLRPGACPGRHALHHENGLRPQGLCRRRGQYGGQGALAIEEEPKKKVFTLKRLEADVPALSRGSGGSWNGFFRRTIPSS